MRPRWEHTPAPHLLRMGHRRIIRTWLTDLSGKHVEGVYGRLSMENPTVQFELHTAHVPYYDEYSRRMRMRLVGELHRVEVGENVVSRTVVEVADGVLRHYTKGQLADFEGTVADFDLAPERISAEGGEMVRLINKHALPPHQMGGVPSSSKVSWGQVWSPSR